jgi:integrase
MRLSDTVARTGALPNGKSDLILWDDKLAGFGLRIRKGAKGVRKHWIIQYRDALRETRRYIIGTLDEIGAAKAREIAGDLLAAIRLGTYPHVEREKDRDRAEKERDRAADTLEAVGKLYLANREKNLRERSFLEVKRHIEKLWEPLARAPVHEIGRRAVALRIAEISERNGPVAANRARATLSAMFGWAMREGIVEQNPVAATNKAVEEESRDRVLTSIELAAIWPACREDDYGRIIRLLMLTGQRREEVGGMLWDELDLERGLWTMAGARTKNGKRHIVPLVPEAIAILRSIPRRTRKEGTADHVFGGGDGGFSGWSKAKANLDCRIAENSKHAPCPVAAWRLHDLRRTMKTAMSDELGVKTEVSEAILNHARQGMEEVYNRAEYLTQKRTALSLWTDHLKSIFEGAERKIILLRPPNQLPG